MVLNGEVLILFINLPDNVMVMIKGSEAVFKLNVGYTIGGR